MPYITKIDRARLMEDDPAERARNAGELNYQLTLACIAASRDQVALVHLTETIEFEIGAFLTHRRDQGNQHQRGKNNYQDFNDVLGAVDGCRREWLRRGGRIGHITNILSRFSASFYENVVGPYEDTKIKQNGDVYPA